MPDMRVILGLGKPKLERRRTLMVASWLAAILVYLLAGAAGFAEGFFDDVFLPVTFGVLLVVASIGCGSFAVREPRDRLAWAFLALGIGLWTLGAVSRTVFFGGSDERPLPAWIDPLFLAFYPAVFIGLVLAIRGRLRRFPDLPWLDGITGILAVASLCMAFAYEPLLESTDGDSLEALTLVAYPAGDLVLIGMLAALLGINGFRRDGPWLYVASGLLLFAIADVIFAILVPSDGLVAGPVWALWILGVLLIVIGTWQDDSDAREWAPGHGQLLLPLIFSIAAVVVLVEGQGSDLAPGAVVLAIATLLAVLARLVISAVENLRMFDNRQLALEDELTGLASSRVVKLSLQDIGVRSPGRPVTLAVIRLAGFKELNSALGYRAGDLLLSAVATRLNRGIGDLGQLGRLAGAEFSLIVQDRSPRLPEQIAEKIRRSLETPILVDGLRVHVDAVTGIAVYPDHGADGTELLRQAELALLDAVARSAGHAVGSRAQSQGAREELKKLADLRSGIGRGELVVFYQPKITGRDRMVRGVEALVRWEHPELGLLGPGDFLDLATSAGLMREITNFVLDTALDQIQIWERDGIQLDVAVNLAMPNLLDTALPDEVSRLLEKRSLKPGRLTLEITENIVMSDPERVLDNLARFQRSGIRISLDDFGVGNTSLSYLRRLPLDEVKMDRSLIANMAARPEDGILATAAIKLTRELGLEVVAEGVEDLEMAALLAELDCSELQGFAFARPMPVDLLETWLAAYTPAT